MSDGNVLHLTCRSSLRLGILTFHEWNTPYRSGGIVGGTGMTKSDQTELAHALFEESGDALFLLDPETDRLIEVNPVALKLSGFTRSEILQFSATYLFRFESAGGQQRLRGAFSKTTVFHSQDGFLLRTKDDTWIPVNLTVSRLHVVPKTLGLIIARDDRERRQALTQARRVEAELRTVLGSSPAALWSAERSPGPDVTAGWQFRYVSPLLARIAGRPFEYFDHPFKWSEVIHPSDRETYRTSLRRLLTGTGTDTEQQYRVMAMDGSIRWVRDRLQVVRDASARPSRLDGCLVDVTEQRQAEEALRQNEQRFRALVEKSRDGIMLIDERGVIRYATPASRLTFGYDPPNVVGKDFFELIHQEDRSSTRKKLARAISHAGEDVPHTFRSSAADGSARTIEMNACNRLDDPSVRALVVNYRDVTERETAALALARQHGLLEGLFASVPDIICYKDRDLRFLGGNPAFEALMGCPVASLIGKTCDVLAPSDWVVRIRAIEPGVLISGNTARGKEWVTYPDGRQVLLDIAVSPLNGNDGTPVGLIITGRDVTEQNKLEDQLRQSYKLEAVGRLAGGIAHDFNNLLTVILGNLELVRHGAAGDDEAELLASTERAAKQAADLTKQMLGFARRQPLRTATLDLNSIVLEAVGLLRRTIDPRIAIQLQTAADLRPVAVDPVQIQQVLMNLCLNARDAMPEGGTLTVETANAEIARRPGSEADAPLGGFVRVSVSDSGVGMSEDVRAKIFEPFFTTKDVGQGTGLGLAVVYGVAQAHGGWVDCTSSPGAGSRFDVFLPRGIASDELVVGPVVTTVAPVRGRGETLILADDEPLVRALAQNALERQGYRVFVAADGAEAVDVFQRENGTVALVILDASMPQMNGQQACAAIRKRKPHTKILFASGHPMNEIAPGDPTTGFLHKPYTPSMLAAAVREMLDSPFPVE
jgi:two-component system, cell cycle sensor histidine kinase and response regulator CckA